MNGEAMRIEITAGLHDGIRKNTTETDIHRGDLIVADDPPAFPAVDELTRIKGALELFPRGHMGSANIVGVGIIDEIIIGVAVVPAGISGGQAGALKSEMAVPDGNASALTAAGPAWS
jgi:hypothetical protein